MNKTVAHLAGRKEMRPVVQEVSNPAALVVDLQCRPRFADLAYRHFNQVDLPQLRVQSILLSASLADWTYPHIRSLLRLTLDLHPECLGSWFCSTADHRFPRRLYSFMN